VPDALFAFERRQADLGFLLRDTTTPHLGTR